MASWKVASPMKDESRTSAILFVVVARVSEFNMAYIYVITNTVNGKQYVGATKYTVEQRFKEHIRDSRRKRCSNRPLYKDINMYGIEYFTVEELEECIDSDKFDRECYWIENLGTYVNGYNLTYGGAGKNFFDYEEIANKYLELKSVCDTAEYFNCDVHTVRKACRKHNIKILASSVHTSKQVDMLDSRTKKILKTFQSAADAALFLGDKEKSKHIGQVCNGSRVSAYGYKWKWH